MEDRNIKKFFQSAFNLKTTRCRDIFQIDTAKCRRNIYHCFNDLFGVLGIQTDRNCVDTAEFFEENRFSFHNRHSGMGSDISETEDSTSVRNYGDRICLYRIFVSCFLIFGDHFTRFSYTRSVGDCQIFARIHV